MIKSLLLTSLISMGIAAPIKEKPHNYLSYFPNQVVNGDFENNSNWNAVGSNINFVDNNLLVSGLGLYTNLRAQQTYNGSLLNHIIYTYAVFNVNSNVNLVSLNYSSIPQFSVLYPTINQDYFVSAINDINTETNTIFELRTATPHTNNLSIITTWKNVGAFNVSQMISNGVKDDNGVLFSDLTNADIKAQLDKWILNEPRDRTGVNLFTTFNDLIKNFIPDDLEATYGEAIFYFTYGLIALFVGTTMYISYKTIRRIIGFGG